MLSEEMRVRLLGAIDTDQLVVLCGAGLSIPDPSNLFSAARVAEECYDRRKRVEQLDPAMRGDLDKIAGHFFSKNDFDSFLRIVPWDDLVGQPNPGHAAIGDLLLAEAIFAVLTSNFDGLIEMWAEAQKAALRGSLDALEIASQVKHRLLKFHGCMRRDREQTLWTEQQFAVPEIEARVKGCAEWMSMILPGKHLVVIGFWTDWGYLNQVLERVSLVGNTQSVTVIDIKSEAELETSAPKLWQVLHGVGGVFTHVQASGAEVLHELRVAFSRAWARQFFDLGVGLARVSALPVPTTCPFDALDMDDLYRVRRDAEGIGYTHYAKRKVPPLEAGGTAYFQLRLLAAGASFTGAWLLMTGKTIRVMTGAGKDLGSIMVDCREPPTLAHADYCVAVGSIDLGVPGRIVASGFGSSFVRPAPGGGAVWLSQEAAEREFSI